MRGIDERRKACGVVHHVMKVSAIGTLESHMSGVANADVTHNALPYHGLSESPGAGMGYVYSAAQFSGLF